jgi:hypothetical protein
LTERYRATPAYSMLEGRAAQPDAFNAFVAERLR